MNNHSEYPQKAEYFTKFQLDKFHLNVKTTRKPG